MSAYSDVEPGVTYVWNRKARQLALQYRIRDELPRESLAQRKPYHYPSSDGLDISAYLTLPKGLKASQLPLIVFPHGGPWARDSFGYDTYAQFLSNRGYAVLQPNFRGSTGYGKKFLNAGNGEWGRKMQDDLTWGVKALVAAGIVDRAHAGIAGGSYGGYATLAGVAFTPDVYAAAVAIVAPSNLITLLDAIPPYWEAGRKQMYTRMADPTTPMGKALLIAVHHPPLSAGGHSPSAAMFKDIQDSFTTSQILPDAILSGHSHCYQRFTWYPPGLNGQSWEVPIFVVGTGGRQVTHIKAATGARTGDYSFESSLQGYGFLTVEATATAISFASPLFVVALSAPILRERVATAAWVGVGLGFLGVLIVVRRSLSHCTNQRGKPGMRMDTPILSSEQIAAANEMLEGKSPQEVLRWAVERFHPRLTMATAFGAEGCCIIHMLAEIQPKVRIFNLETGYQFKETLETR